MIARMRPKIVTQTGARLNRAYLSVVRTTRQRLGEVAARLGVRRVSNLGSCPAS
jgi:hypothetical protein